MSCWCLCCLLHLYIRENSSNVLLLLQIGAYDQQVWEKSLEQADLNVRHLQRKWIIIRGLVLCITAILKIPLAIFLGFGEPTQKDWSHQTRPHWCRLSKRWASMRRFNNTYVICIQTLHTDKHISSASTILTCHFCLCSACFPVYLLPAW